MPRKTFKPHDYQRDIAQHQLDLARGGVWAAMGTGKTVSTLTAQASLQMSGEETKPFLVLAPLRVAKFTWPDEAAKWEHLSGTEITPIIAPNAQTRHNLLFKALASGNSAGYTINYENIPWLIKTLKDTRMGWPFGTLIADELTRLKSHRTHQGGQRARALAAVAHSHVSRFVGLTGTPAPNGLKDLWGQTWFIDRGQRLGSTYTAFMNRWFHAHPSGYGMVAHEWAEEQIHDVLRDIYVSIDHKLPVEAPIENTIRVELPDKARQAYREMEKQMFTELHGHELEAATAAAKSIKCLQLASGAAYTDDKGNWVEVHDAKLQALASVVEEANGMPVLVAYHFKSDLARLKRHFPHGRVFDTDEDTLRDWNAGRLPIMFVHPSSSGHGISLQDGGNIIVFFSHWWSLEEFQQVIERIGPVRQMQAGHKRPVFIHYIVARDTLDEAVMDRRMSKADVQDVLLAAMRRREKGKELGD